MEEGNQLADKCPQQDSLQVDDSSSCFTNTPITSGFEKYMESILFSLDSDEAKWSKKKQVTPRDDGGQVANTPIQRRWRAAFSDFSNAFRLYFGTNVTVFPFVIAVSGSLGGPLLCVLLLAAIQGSVVQLLQAKLLALKHVATTASPGEIDTFVRLSQVLFSPKSLDTPEQGDPCSSRFLNILTEVVVCVAQFGSCCNFTILIATNISALLGLTLTASLVLASFTLCILVILYHRRTMLHFSIVNNVCLFGAGALILYATLTNQNGTAEDRSQADNDTISAFPQSLTAFLLIVPFTSGYLSGSLYAVDVEAAVSRRVLMFAAASTSSKTLELEEGCSSTTVAPSPRPSLSSLLGRFERLSLFAFIVALLSLGGLGELVYFKFKSRTNAIVALTLESGPLRSTLLVVLIIGCSSCATLNVAAIMDILDRCNPVRKFVGTSILSSEFLAAAANRITIRCSLFIAVLLIVLIMPYFDLVASLTGAVGLSAITFFIPPLLQLQGHRRKLQAERGQSTAPTWMEGFYDMSQKHRVMAVMAVLFGMFNFFVGSSVALGQIVLRRETS